MKTATELLDISHDELYIKYKQDIIHHLIEWANTFIGDTEEDEDGEEVETDGYDTIMSLANSFEGGEYTENDLEEIYFHLSQIAEGEE